MKMSVTNTGQRRMSMLSFTGLFLLTIALSFLAFTKSMGLKETFPRQELDALKEKEKVLASFAELSQALGQYEDAQRSDAASVNKEYAACREKSADLHILLKSRDTTRIYQDVRQFLTMADRYMLSIKQLGNESDEQVKSIEEELARLRQRNNDLQAEKNTLQTNSASLQLEKSTLTSQLAMAKMKKESSGGGGQGAVPPPVNCTIKVNEYKGDVIKVAGSMQKNLAEIQTELEKMSGFLVFAKNKKEKNSIQKNLEALGVQLTELQSQ